MSEPAGLVHVIDDDEAVRDSLGFLLEAAGFQVAIYGSGRAFLEAWAPELDGCVVTDVRMPGMTGLELAAQLNAMGSTLPVVVITGHGDVPLAVEAMKVGAHDFIEKPFDEEAILSAVGSALAASRAAGDGAGERAEIRRRIETLSGRERQVLEGLVEGKANKVIARDLGISPRTVEIYRANLMTKMAARSLSELVRKTIIAGG